jgi:hypothetical protein
MKLSQILKIEIMEPTVIKRILIGIIIYLMAFNSLYGQTTSESNKMFQRTFSQKNKLDPFFYFGNEIKKGNTHCYEILENDLVADVPVPADVLCRNNYGIFAFKINRKGKIEKLEYEGDLDSSIVRKIKLNIRKTEGNYTRPSKSNQESFHWFVLPFMSNGYHLGPFSCANAVKLEIEFNLESKRARSYLNIIEFLPDFPSLTVLHNMDHLSEMIKTGMIKYDTM